MSSLAQSCMIITQCMMFMTCMIPGVNCMDNTAWSNTKRLGGGNLLRDLDVLRNRAAFFSRGSRDPRNYRYDTFLGSTIGGVKRAAGVCCDSLSGIALGGQKRNMDEIDRTGFNSFIKKNFDEIDRSGFGSFVKRNFDEIDRSGFGGFVKRSASPAVAEQVHN